MNMKEEIKSMLLESSETKKKTAEQLSDKIEQVIRACVKCYQNGGKVLIFGNGGSAAEFVNRYKLDRPPMAAIAVTTDTSILTSIANDSGYEDVFKKPIEALCNKGDVVFAITTSDIDDRPGGHSANIARGLRAAREKGAVTVGLFSMKSKKVLEYVDIAIQVPSTNTPRIQEAHIAIIHTVCEILERELYQNAKVG